MRQLRVATQNQGKLRELREMLAPRGVRVLGVDDLPGFAVVEDGDSFAANAIKKAAALAAAASVPALGDDSGLVVDALGGAPGIYSARYAGEGLADQDAQNRRKLLHELRDVPEAKRTARFVCALAYVALGEEPLVFHGTLEGRIGTVERGSGGFGYDSLFIAAGGERTVAELESEEKHAISHRGVALRAFLGWLG